MITRTNRNRKNDLNRLASVSRGIAFTAVAAAVLNPSVYAQTNSSSGINRSSAQKEAQAPTRNQTTPGARTQIVAGKRASSTNNKAVNAAKAQTAAARRAAARRQTSQAPVKVIIRGTREDARLARQQGLQSLQNANAAIAAQNAEAAAQAEAANNAANAAAAQNAALANAQYNFQTSQYGYGYGYVPPFVNGGAPYGAAPVVPFGSAGTVAPITAGVPAFGAPTVGFPSYYTTYAPGVFSSFSTFSF